MKKIVITSFIGLISLSTLTLASAGWGNMEFTLETTNNYKPPDPFYYAINMVLTKNAFGVLLPVTHQGVPPVETPTTMSSMIVSYNGSRLHNCTNLPLPVNLAHTGCDAILRDNQVMHVYGHFTIDPENPCQITVDHLQCTIAAR